MPRRQKTKPHVSFTNLNKVFFPKAGFTKGELIGGGYWKGDLKLWLSGVKLSGEWHLFRIKSEEDKPVWLISEAAKKITAKQENTSVLSGRRALGIKQGATAQLRSHDSKDLAADFPDVVTALRTLKADTAVVDGEVVALDQHGRPSFELIQNQRANASAIVFYAFDLLSLNGEDWRARPLDERKAKLAEVTADSDVKLSLSFEGRAETIVAKIKKLGLEGVIAKRRDARYESGRRSRAWLKFKVSREQEV